MEFVQVMNAGFENEFYLLKSVLRYRIYSKPSCDFNDMKEPLPINSCNVFY